MSHDISSRVTSFTSAKGGTNLEPLRHVVNAAGDRTSMTDSAATTSWTCDNLDRSGRP